VKKNSKLGLHTETILKGERKLKTSSEPVHPNFRPRLLDIISFILQILWLSWMGEWVVVADFVISYANSVTSFILMSLYSLVPTYLESFSSGKGHGMHQQNFSSVSGEHVVKGLSCTRELSAKSPSLSTSVGAGSPWPQWKYM
jgi:hypothetical protein